MFLDDWIAVHASERPLAYFVLVLVLASIHGEEVVPGRTIRMHGRATEQELKPSYRSINT